jgi:phage N-6-adenine-methyltransferase
VEELTVLNSALPDTLPELAKYALFGRELLNAKRAEIRAISKLELAKGVHQQKLQEAQEIAELVTISEMRIGAMLKEIQKANNGGANQYRAKSTPVANEQKPKSEVIREIGIEQKTAERFQRMADHEEAVMEAIAEAKENDEIVTRSAVLRKIDEAEHKPHVSFNSGNNEWYTPTEYIEAARNAMGTIDLDPASSDIAQEVVKAKTYYTIETNGLDKPWRGNIWLNPPYSSDSIVQFIDKLVEERPYYQQAIVLVNNATETEWFNKLISIASAVCFLKSRVKFYMPDGKTGAPLQGQAMVYIGNRPTRFSDSCANLGWRCMGIEL